MHLFPILDKHQPTVAEWLGARENYQWLHFGHGIQQVTPVALRVMLTRNIHELRLFGDSEDSPAGIVALSDINPNFKSATLWYVLGDKSHGGKGMTTQAARLMLAEGFGNLDLTSIYAWAVEDNKPSIKVLTNCGFKFIGRRRRGHCIDDKFYDVLLFDILSTEMVTKQNPHEHVTDQ